MEESPRAFGANKGLVRRGSGPAKRLTGSKEGFDFNEFETDLQEDDLLNTLQVLL